MSLQNTDPSVLAGGELKSIGMIELLGLVFSTRATGTLRINRGRSLTNIHCFNGIPVNAETTGSGPSLLDLVAEEKKLSAEDVLQVKQLARDKGKDIGDILRTLFDISESQLYYFRSQTIKELIISSCAFRDGAYEFRPHQEFDNIWMFDLNPLEIIFDGMVRYHFTGLFNEIYKLEKRKVRLNPRVKDFFMLPGPLYEHSHALDVFSSKIELQRGVSILQQELGDINLALFALALLLLTKLVVFESDLQSDEVISDFEGIRKGAGRQADKAESPQEPDVDTGYIITRARKPKPKPQPAIDTAREPASTTRPESPFPKDPRPEKKPAPPAEESRTEKQTSTGPDLAKARQTLAEWKEKLDMAMNLYGMLDSTPEDDAVDIQEIFFERKRELENYLQSPDGEILAQSRAILSRLEQACQTLIEPPARIEYERELVKEEKKRAWQLPMQKSLAHKMEIRGNWYMRHNEPGYAVEMYQTALDLDAKSARSYMNLGWAMFRARMDQVEARSYIESAIKIDGELSRAHYYLGILSKREGMEDDAERYFRAALELDPDDNSARRELALITQHKKQKGLWSKLFGG